MAIFVQADCGCRRNTRTIPNVFHTAFPGIGGAPPSVVDMHSTTAPLSGVATEAETDMSQPKKDDAKPTLFGFDMLARLNSLAVRDEVGFIVFLISTLIRVVAAQSQSA